MASRDLCRRCRHDRIVHQDDRTCMNPGCPCPKFRLALHKRVGRTVWELMDITGS